MRQLFVLFVVLYAGSASAALLGRMPATPGGTDYQAYYDTAQDITWLADANYASTSGWSSPEPLCPGPYYDSPFQTQDGAMELCHVELWLDSLNSSNHLGVSDWRLPALQQPDPDCDSVNDPGDGSPVQYFGYGCLNGELNQLFYTEIPSV